MGRTDKQMAWGDNGHKREYKINKTGLQHGNHKC